MAIINSVIVSGGGSGPAHYVEKTVDANGKLQNGNTMIDLTGVTDLGNYVLAYAYYSVSFPSNTNIDMSSITNLSGNSSCYFTFSSCTGITHVDLSSLTTISGQNDCYNMFASCVDLATVDISSLTTISSYAGCQNMFYMSGLTAIDISSLTTISGQNACLGMFNSCTKLVSIKLNSLNVITSPLGASYTNFAAGCFKLESIEFGGLTASTFSLSQNQLQYLFNATTGRDAPNGCTVHFPSNFDPSDPNHTFDASTLAGYPTFGGNASYIHVAFDLPATE